MEAKSLAFFFLIFYSNFNNELVGVCFSVWFPQKQHQQLNDSLLYHCNKPKK